MDNEVFKDEEFSKFYQEKMFPISKKITNLIISFLEEKMGRPFELAVDAGCGTGRSTRVLAEHFSKVIGIDISETQINEARKCTPQENVTYQVLPAEKMPLEDASVDLVNADTAVHWFPVDQFLPEVTRVLKNRGCLALHCLYPMFTIKYKNCSETLTKIFNEAVEDSINKLEKKRPYFVKSMYQEIFEALPFSDKQRVTDITEVFHVSLEQLLGFLKVTCMLQKRPIEERAAFIKSVKERLADAMGGLSGDEILEFHMNYFCLLACKS